MESNKNKYAESLPLLWVFDSLSAEIPKRRAKKNSEVKVWQKFGREIKQNKIKDFLLLQPYAFEPLDGEKLKYVSYEVLTSEFA